MITVDNTFVSDASVYGAGTTSYSVTNAGDLMIVVVYIQQTTGAGVCTGVKYNGVSFTQYYADLVLQQLKVFYLKNPDIGTYTLEVTLDAGIASNLYRSGGISLLGTHPSNYLGGTASSSFVGSNSTNEITVTVQGLLGIVVDFIFLNKIGAPDATVGSGQTSFIDYFADDNSTVVFARASYEAHTGSDTVMGWTSINTSSTTRQMHYAMEILPAPPFIPTITMI